MAVVNLMILISYCCFLVAAAAAAAVPDDTPCSLAVVSKMAGAKNWFAHCAKNLVFAPTDKNKSHRVVSFFHASARRPQGTACVKILLLLLAFISGAVCLAWG